MANNARIQRLTREALGNEEGSVPPAGKTISFIAIIVSILFAAAALSDYQWDGREIVVTSANHRYIASGQQNSPAQRQHVEAGKAASDGNVSQQAEAGKKEPEGNVQDLTY